VSAGAPTAVTPGENDRRDVGAMDRPEPAGSSWWHNGNTTLYALASLIGAIAALITALNGCVAT